MTNQVIEAICSRRSIRKYSDRSVETDKLVTVLEAGTYAPTGHNRQDPIIVAVRNSGIIKTLSRLNAGIMGTDSDPYYGAKVIILVFVPKVEDNPNAVQDGSLVLGNMMLAAHSLGLASCWFNREKQMFSTPEGKLLQGRLGVDPAYEGLGALSLGYPLKPNPKPLERKKDYYRIID